MASQEELSCIGCSLFLGSEKDIEDAAHLYEVFKHRLDIGLTEDFARRLGVEKEMERFLK